FHCLPFSLCFFLSLSYLCLFFFFHDTATTEIYTLSLHDALPIFGVFNQGLTWLKAINKPVVYVAGNHEFYNSEYHQVMAMLRQRSEEHTSELQSRENLVCRLLLEKKKRHSST